MDVLFAAIEDRMYWEGLWTVPDYRIFSIIYWLIVGAILAFGWRGRKKKQTSRWPIVVLAVFGLLIFYIVAPVLISASAASKMSQFIVKQRILATACLIYAGDHDDRLPLARNWEDAIRPRVDVPNAFLAGPMYPEGARIAFNKNLSGVETSQIRFASRTVLLFVSAGPGTNAHGVATDVVRRKGNNLSNIFSVADGSTSSLSDVVWTVSP